jgi:hypothetical protein
MTFQAILIMKIVFLKVLQRRTFKKNDFSVSSAEGARNTKIVFIMRIAVTLRAIN